MAWGLGNVRHTLHLVAFTSRPPAVRMPAPRRKSLIPALPVAFLAASMSGAGLILSSQSLPNLSSLALQPRSLTVLSSSSPGSVSRRFSASGKGDSADSQYNVGLIEICGAIKSALEILGLSDIVRRAISLIYKKRQEIHSLRSNGTNLSDSASKRLLFLALWSLGCISLSLITGLLALSRGMLRSQFYTAALRLGIAPSSQQTNHNQKDDVPSSSSSSLSTSELQDRLEVANLAVKHLKGEGLGLQEKLKEAGTRIARLEASQADHVAFQALQAKYGQVEAEIARLTKENEELKSKLTQLGKENAELRQCLAIKEPDEEGETNRLGMLARLQNQQLDSSSCIFSKDAESEKPAVGKAIDATDDSIVIVSSTESPRRDFGSFDTKSTPLFSFSMPLSNAVVRAGSQGLLSPSYPAHASDCVSTPTSGAPNPIPVFVTKRPSLPPKASKLKPLLLATRNGARHAGSRRNSIRRQRGNSFNSAFNSQVENTPKTTSANARTLNPMAPTFTPRNVTTAITPGGGPALANASDSNKENEHEAKAVPIVSSLSKAPSPSSSPFIITSPSPNSPFLRPPPQRRQSGDAPFPKLVTTPPTPTTPVPVSSAGVSSADNGTSSGVGDGFKENKGTPRSTRASSVKLIRARAAMRNSQRVASGSFAIAPDSPAGFKELNAAHMRVASLGAITETGSISDLNSKAARANAAKTRLIGKGVPPARRALGEVTNAELMKSENSVSRWTSV